MDEIIVGINLFVACLALAYLEVQIEGPHGWAEKLPTWKIDTPWIRKLTNGKPITGYHVGMNAVILAFVHLPLAWNEWSMAFELRTLSYFFIIAVWWDFLWFLINPHYGIRRFKTENIWWHDKWILGIPKDYYVGTFVSVLCWLLADLATPGPAITLVTWCMVAGVVVGGTFASGLVVEVLRRTGDAIDEKAAEKLVPEEIEDDT
jgi:hypothetical protein